MKALTEAVATCRLAVGHIKDRVTGIGLLLWSIRYIVVVRPVFVSLFTIVIVLGAIEHRRGPLRMRWNVVR